MHKLLTAAKPAAVVPTALLTAITALALVSAARAASTAGHPDTPQVLFGECSVIWCAVDGSVWH